MNLNFHTEKVKKIDNRHLGNEEQRNVYKVDP